MQSVTYGRHHMQDDWIPRIFEDLKYDNVNSQDEFCWVTSFQWRVKGRPSVCCILRKSYSTSHLTALISKNGVRILLNTLRFNDKRSGN